MQNRTQLEGLLWELQNKMLAHSSCPIQVTINRQLILMASRFSEETFYVKKQEEQNSTGVENRSELCMIEGLKVCEKYYCI